MTELAIVWCPETTSTQDLASRGVSQGARSGTVWVTDHQTEGRGRRVSDARRVWSAPPATSVLMSLLLRLDVPVPAMPAMALVAAVAACDFLRDRTGVGLQIKWPNDLVVGTRKLGGILAEASLLRGAVDGVVIGLGLNVSTQRADFPAAFADAATSLHLEGSRTLDRLTLVTGLAQAIAAAAQTFEVHGDLTPFMDAWNRYDATAGRSVVAQIDGVDRVGMADGIDVSGQLAVRLPDGTRPLVRSGEVTFTSRTE